MKVICLNDQTQRIVTPGTTLHELIKHVELNLNFPVLGALVNNKVRDLSYPIHKTSIVNFFDISSQYGYDMYTRSAYFILSKAVSDTLPKAELHIMHSISGGKYCELSNLDEPLNDTLAMRIKDAMYDIVDKDIPFERSELLTEEAIAAFEEQGLFDKSKLFRQRKKIFTSTYKLADKISYYYGFLLPSTGYVNMFSLELYENGLLLKIPARKNPTAISHTRKMPKLYSVYQKHKEWVSILGVPYIGDINEKVEAGEIRDFIKISEAFHEKTLANIADEVHQKEGVKMVLISGPSSSGKTTSCKRLAVQLSVLGYHPVQISVDDFFVERENTPLDADGNYDFEAIEAIDLPLFNNTLGCLLEGKEVALPTFNFTTGKKEWRGNKIQLREKSIILAEGIHCLNPKLTSTIDNSTKFKVFVSALTSISIDSQNPIPTTDNRLIRRIIRDYRYRNYSALDTLRRWQSVRSGEEKNIFPYQENADAMFNASLICELGILKSFAEPILKEVPENEVEYAEANRLLKFLSYFETISEEDIPGTSILREFFGGSYFYY